MTLRAQIPAGGSGSFFVIRRIFKPYFENSSYLYLILIGTVSNQVSLLLFVDF
jgi:hypothetical protein